MFSAPLFSCVRSNQSYSKSETLAREGWDNRLMLDGYLAGGRAKKVIVYYTIENHFVFCVARFFVAWFCFDLNLIKRAL